VALKVFGTLILGLNCYRTLNITDIIITKSGGEPWRLTCVYGEAQVAERHKIWETLKFIKASSYSMVVYQ
jgi:hypothetical protein